ncbi:myosin-binding protein 1 isoform X2 [Malania oleifera]|uniref:myosin-binding protein 1 isoform X2 n=1 Tax=Malania oleifera TaxID=397392 RepID=UPI0025ADFC29|nr:myosin-binding protein 1 isoform X2 [Malania oleifera]XP_057962970.1 myosin-binding protein 1 isoform X2 [Malania oleifera]
MAVAGISSTQSQTYSQVTRFARHCGLQTPCLICSRLDHVLGNEKLGFYLDLICRNHKLEISSLVFCHAHNKIVDVHGMCENCLFSFATINKSNAETYRLLVGKLGAEPHIDFDEDPSCESHNLGSLIKRHCCCCNNLFISGGYAQKLLQTELVGPKAAEFDLPLSSAIVHDCADLKKRENKSSGPVHTSQLRNSGFDPLSHIGYSELKITSDTESDVLLSDDDDTGALVRETDGPKEDFQIKCVQMEPHIVTSTENFISEKLIHPPSKPEDLVSFSKVQLVNVEPNDGTVVAGTDAVGHGLEELSWQQAEPKIDSSGFAQLISHEAAPQSSNATETAPEVLGASDSSELEKPSVTETGDICKTGSGSITTSEAAVETSLQVPNNLEVVSFSKVQLVNVEPNDGTVVACTDAVGHGLEELSWQQAETKIDSSGFAQLISHEAAPQSSNATETAPEVLGASGSSGLEKPSVTETGDIRKTGSGSITTSEASVETSLQVPNNLELGDAYKIAVGNRGRQFSGLLAEQWSGKDSAKVNEDLKLLLSQISANRGIDLPLNDMSPRVSLNIDELKSSDASGTVGLQILQKRKSLERNESGFESLDGSVVSEIEGESLVDRLKRQVEHDRKSLNALYKDLEEERNASAVAANQAMAMITRLQEEKAALHMEALQYLRMMEEQAEYDMEALQKANDLLSEREKEMQDLEEELEFCRKKLPNEPILESIVRSASDLKPGGTRLELSDASHAENNASSPSNSVAMVHVLCDELEGSEVLVGGKNTSIVKNLLSELEDERSSISKCLKKLEKKLLEFSNNGLHSDLANGEYSANEGDELNNLNTLEVRKGSEENSRLVESSGSPSDQEGRILSFQGNEFVSKENSEFNSSGQGCPMICRETDFVALGNEVSDLKDRLEALEADRNFLEHTINSIRNGDEGLKLVQELVHHLRELRRTEIRRDQPN